MNALSHLLAPVALATALAAPACADHARVYSEGGIALGGFDVVIYFTENRAERGSTDHSLMWRGATWLFTSSDTMSAFEMNPKAYAPQYGGYCAYAMSEGRIAAPSPEAFSIVDGKLYLNDSVAARDEWAQDMDANIIKANAHWQALKQK